MDQINTQEKSQYEDFDNLMMKAADLASKGRIAELNELLAGQGLDITVILESINKEEKVEEMGKLLKILAGVAENRMVVVQNLAGLLQPIMSGQI